VADSKAIILNRMLADIDSNYDKSQGSFFYDVLSATATEFEKKYKENENEIRKKHINSAVGKELEELVKEYANMERKHSTQSSDIVIITGSNGFPIIEGEMVASDNLNFIFTESSTIVNGTAAVKVKCETYGSTGNVPASTIKYFPKTLPGLQTVTNTEPFINGYDEETDDELKARYYEKIGEPQTNSNIAEYRAWAKSIIGVGDARVLPLWNGVGTIKIVLINSNKLPVEQNLIDNVHNYILSVRSAFSGTLTVVSANSKAITISVTLDIDTLNYTADQVETNIETNITEYLKEIAFKQDYVSYAQLGNKILNSDGVKDYSNLVVNNGTSNVAIGETEIAILGGVAFG